MSRLFLNEPDVNGNLGFFRENNPSGAVSGSPNLPAGSQAGFAEGVQTSNTTNTNGARHDITNMALDADFSDLDGDFDLDIFANSRDTPSRFYSNRFVENGNILGLGTNRLFRDVSNLWGTNGLSTLSVENYDVDLNRVLKNPSKLCARVFLVNSSLDRTRRKSLIRLARSASILLTISGARFEDDFFNTLLMIWIMTIIPTDIF